MVLVLPVLVDDRTTIKSLLSMVNLIAANFRALKKDG